MRYHEPDSATIKMAGLLPLDERVFKKTEINSCCRNGGQPIGDTDIFPEDLSSYLEHAHPDLEIHDSVALAADLPTDELANFVLKECHRPLGARLLNLETLIEMIEDSHGEEREAGEMMSRVRGGFEELRAAVLEHLLKEEDILFPWIVSGNGSSAVEMIGDLKEQHKIIAVKAKTVLAQAAWLIGRQETCSGERALHAAMGEFVRELAVHINVENHVLYPRALSGRG